MNSSFDLLLTPLIASGQAQQDLTGLIIAKPPRRVARGRDGDQLFLSLILSGNSPLSKENQQKMLSGLTDTFYKTPGTVTAALNNLAEAINEFLLNRNMRSATSGNQALGLLTLGVLRGEHFYIAQTGSNHVFVISNGKADYLYDLQQAGRGLGMNKTVTIRFAQVDLHPNDIILFTPQLPSAWNTVTLQTINRQGLDSMHRYLLSHLTQGSNAIMIQVQPGKGKINLLSGLRASTQPIQPGPEPERHPQPVPQASLAQITSQKPGSGTGDDKSLNVEPLKSITSITRGPNRYSSEKLRTPLSTTRTLDSRPTIETPQDPSSTKPKPIKSYSAKAWRPFKFIQSLLIKIGHGIKIFFKTIAWGILSLLQRILPDEGFFNLPPSTMIFVAIIVPFVVVTFASLTYFQRGRGTEYLVYYTQAKIASEEAQKITDPGKQHIAWDTVLVALNQAEKYKITLDSKSLRLQAQDIIDRMDSVQRLDYRLAFTPKLGDRTQIDRLITNANDLYMLSIKEGKVWRANRAGNSYRIDPNFQCGPGIYDGKIVGALVSITAISASEETDATLLAIDKNSNLLYCIPNNPPAVAILTTPGTNWGIPKSLVFNSNDLYILDPEGNAVWVYRNMEITEQPILFFGNEIPRMADVIDMVVNGNDLFLLHADGHITRCAYSGIQESNTQCDDPAKFIDPRSGVLEDSNLASIHYSQMIYSPPPDPSLYFLEQNSQGIYHFGVGLTFQRLFKSQNTLPTSSVTAFTIDRSSNLIFLAFGDRIYFAPFQ